MITDLDIKYKHINGLVGYALAWIIDEDCVETLTLNKEYAEMFILCNNIIDISDQYPEHGGITVRLIKDDTVINDFQTSEYFGSILLSNPVVVSLHDYPYGAYVSPNNAKFINNNFIINDKNMDELTPYPYGQLKPGDNI